MVSRQENNRETLGNHTTAVLINSHKHTLTFTRKIFKYPVKFVTSHKFFHKNLKIFLNSKNVPV